jgi:hypothetical protein
MKSIKEKQLLVKWARAMNEPVDPALAEEVDRYNQLQQEIKESIRSNTINDLFDASKVAVEIINKVTIEYPKPPTLEELLSIVQEESNELVQAQAAETPTTIEEASPPDTPRTKAVEPTDLISRAAEHIHKEVKLEETSFQQPQPTPVEKNFNDVQKKLKFLEQAIGKIAATGPGSGEVELKRLDDVDFASVSGATNNQVLSYNATSQLWFARSVTSGGGGIALTDLSVTVDVPSGNGNLTYNDTTGVFNFSPANVIAQVQSDWNVSDTGNVSYIKNKPTIPTATSNLINNSGFITTNSLTTANVVELTNLYFTNARSVAALTAGSNIIIESNGRISASVNIPSQLQSDWNQTDSGNVEYIKNKPNLSNLEIAANVLAVTHEPMGFEERTDSNISFNDATRTFTITPAVSSYNVWVSGTRYTINNTRTVALPNTTGLYYIYYSNTGSLSYKTTFYDWPNEAPTAYVYWNSNVENAPFIADERHGIVLDWQTHEYLHRTRGAAIANGFDATNYIVGGNGSSNTHLQLDIADGTFFDEDLQVDIVSTNTPTANTWEQDLTGPARIPMFFLNGAGAWVIDGPTNFPVKQGTRPKYNLYSGGVWTTPDIDNNKFGVTFIIATNNINYPIIGIIGQDSHANQGDAEAIEFSDLNLTGFPVVEMRPLYKLVYDCKNSYTNSIKARLVSIWDQRSFESTTSAIATYTDHGALSGLLDDDHTQYLLRTDANSVIYSNVISIGYATNAQLATYATNTQLTVYATNAQLAVYATNAQLASYATTANLALKANIVDLTTANVTELTNLYFTNARATSAVTNTSLSNITILGNTVINGNVTTSKIITSSTIGSPTNTALYNLSAANTFGGTGYADVIKLTNTSGGIANLNKFIRLNTTGSLEIINSAYLVNILTLDDAGNLSIGGYVSPGKWTAGQVIKDTMLSNSEVTVSTTTVATSTNDTDFMSYSYTPVSSSSYLVIHVHVSSYDALSASGTGSDSYFSRIKVGGNEITYSRQATRDNYGFRTGSLFPLTGRYTNSDTSAKTITVAVRRDTADDNISIVNTSTALWMRITEIAR